MHAQSSFVKGQCMQPDAALPGLFGARLTLVASCCKALKLPFSLSDCPLGLFGARF